MTEPSPATNTQKFPATENLFVDQKVITVKSDIFSNIMAAPSQLKIAYRLIGPSHRPVIGVCGGISSGRWAGGIHCQQAPWWPTVVGQGLGIDTQKFRVLSFDYFGGNGLTSGPRDDNWLEISVTTEQQSHLLAVLLDVLKIEQLAHVVGASYGAMVALSFGCLYPNRAKHLVVISGAHKAHPMATAWRILQRKILNLGPDVRHIRLARALAMTTYRTPEEFSQRFSSQHDIERYLLKKGSDYIESMNPLAYKTLSQSIDCHLVNPNHIDVPFDIIGFRQDRLIPIEQLRELDSATKKSQLHEFDSIYGHDAFLKEDKLINKLLHQILRIYNDNV